MKDHPTNWDYDWYANDILTIAKDEVAQESPAQYPFVIYTQNYEEKAFMHKFPETVMPSAELRSVDEYKHVVGSNITTENKLDATDISIITLVGDSALKTGGLSLSDIYTILFFDWDDSLLGTLTAGVGEDPTEAVHKYTLEKFVHPTLRELDFTTMSAEDKKKRKNNYRGEYPEDGPASGNPLEKSGDYGDEADEPGSKYPLTNKLDYAFAGKNLADEDHPYTFAYGWTQVLPDAPDYSDKDKYPGQTADILPKAMEDTITAATVYDQAVIGFAPELDASGKPKEPDAAIPHWVACDFAGITQEDLKASDGNLYVKAVYECCENLGKNGTGGTLNTYVSVGPAKTEIINTAGSVSTYGISFMYERINKNGYGVSRITEPAVNMALTQVGASGSTPVEIILENGEKISVMLTPTNAVDTVGYQLMDTYNLNVVTGEGRSAANDLDEGIFKLQGTSGLIYQFNMYDLLDQAYAFAKTELDTGTKYIDSSDYNKTWATAATFKSLALYQSSTNTKPTELKLAAKLKVAQAAVVNLVRDTVKSGADYRQLDWYQIQYYIIKTTAKTTVVPYTDDATLKKEAKEYIQANAQGAENAYLALG